MLRSQAVKHASGRLGLSSRQHSEWRLLTGVVCFG